MTDAPETREKGLTDLHSHLVPGVDDGARTPDEAVEALRTFLAAGVTRVVTTPHLEAGLTESRTALEDRLDRMDAAWERLREAAGGAVPGVELGRGFEILLDLPEPDLGDERLHLDRTRYVLVEWPRLRLPRETARILGGLRAQGVVPVVAHAERYAGLGAELERAQAWRDAGALLQVNHGAILGRYGKHPRRRALDLLSRGMVDLLASDYHGRAGMECHVTESRRWFDELGAPETFHLLASVNPGRVLDDGEPVPVPPLEGTRTLVDRLKSLLNLDRAEP